MPINKTKGINLIPQEEFESSTFGRVLKWALSTFRIMVITTEFIVMSAFLSRFWLDSRNSDLNDELTAKKSQVLAYSEVEKQLRFTQNKIGIAKNIYLLPRFSNLISDISKLVPVDVTLISMSILDSEIQIKAASYTERSIAQLLINLQSYKSFTDANLSQVSSNIENPLITMFTIKALVKNQ